MLGLPATCLMALTLDHIVITVTDLARARADYGRLGFEVLEGGEHADGVTHNALVVLADGTYLELIAFQQPAPERRWWRVGHEAGEGFVDFALLPGDMAADVALNRDLMAAYPFCRLTGPANVLVMPAFHSASISTRMLQELGGSTVVGPLIVGLDKPVQIVSLGSTDTDLVRMAALASYNVGG